MKQILSFKQPTTESEPAPDTLGVTFTADSALLCVGNYRGEVRMYNANNHFNPTSTVLNSQMADGTALTSVVTCLRMRPMSGRTAMNVILATCSDGSVSQWHLGSSKMISSVREEEGTMCADYSPFGAQYVTVGKDFKVRIYSEAKSAATATLTQGGRNDENAAHRAPIQSVRWINENTILTGGWDRVVQIWDVRAQRPQAYLSGPYLYGDGLDYHPDVGPNGAILTASHREKDQIEMWDASSFEKIHTSSWPPEPERAEKEGDAFIPCNLFAAKFSPDGKTFAAGGNHDCKVFTTPTSAASLEVIGSCEPEDGIKHAVFGLAWSPNGRHLALTGADHGVRVLAC